MKNKQSIIYYLLLVVGVIMLINVLSDRFFFRLDFTEDNRYTLSKATKDILENLDQPITITVYFTDDLQPQYEKIRRDFRELLVEYSTISRGKVVYEFINPNEDEKIEQEAMQKGIQPVIIQDTEKDQAVQKKAYMGAVIQLGEDSEVLPMIPFDAMEYSISRNIKKLTIKDKPVIGLLQGHGEANMQSLRQAMGELSFLYTVMPVNLSDSTKELDKYKTVAIVSPKDSFPQSHLDQLDEFLAQGKNLFIAMNRVDADLQNSQSGSTLNTGLETWLNRKGVQVETNFVIDQQCIPIGVVRQQGMFSIQQQVQFPYFPIITKFGDHPISKGLEQVLMQFASTISYMGDSTKTFTPLAETSEKSGTRPSPTYFDISKRWSEADFPLSNMVVGGVLEGKIVGNVPSRVVIIADGDFPLSPEGNQQMPPDNISLMVNSIDWLSDATGLIDLRTKGITSRPIDQLEDGKRTFLKIFNFVLPILLIIAYGIFRMLRRQNLRIKRMEEGYV